MFLTTLIYAGIVPLAVAAAATLFVRNVGGSSAAAWAWGMSVGFVAAQLGLKADAGWATAARALAGPNEAVDWLAIIVLLALGTSLLLIATPLAFRRYAWAVAFAFSVAAALRLLAGNAAMMGWSLPSKIGCLALLVALFNCFWWMLSARDGGTSQRLRLCLVIVVAIGSAAVLTLSGVLVYGQLSGAVAAALGGCALASIVADEGTTPRLSFAGFRGAAGPITFSLVSLIILGHFFAELSTLNAMLLLAALAVAGGPVPGGLAGQAFWMQSAVRTLLCLVPLAGAVANVAAYTSF